MRFREKDTKLIDTIRVKLNLKYFIILGYCYGTYNIYSVK